MTKTDDEEFVEIARDGEDDDLDIKVEEKGEEFLINTTTDNQLDYAIKLLIG